MEYILSPKVIHAAFLVFIWYFIILTAYYLLLAVIGFIEEGRRSRQEDVENYPLIYFSTLAVPVSIIIPAHNEEIWIRDCLLSVLNLNHPKFEVIIVDDGSTDKTLAILDEILQLKSIDMPYIKHYRDGHVREMLKSARYPNVMVVAKIGGLKKAGAINAGLNMARYEFVCVIDADTVLERDALIKTMAQVEKDPERIVGIGSYFGLANGIKIKDGKILKRSFSWNPLIAYQNLEYIRSFIGNRIAWSRFNSMPIIAGAFSIWKRQMLYDLGGYALDFTCEDIELTFRVHDYMAKNRAKNQKIVMLPYMVGWTEGPADIESLISQRERWQRVTNETIWKYKYMLFNPKFKAFAFLTLPYFILYEVLGVFMEMISLTFVGVGWFAGVLDVKAFLAFLCLMVLSQAIVSLVSIFAFIRGRRVFSFLYITYLILLSMVEFFMYRWIISAAKLIGTFKFFTGIRSFDQYAREKRK